MISAFIIAKDAQKTIKKALESLTFADEVLVFDDASKDETVNIAQKYTDKVYRGPLLRGFSEKRNDALKKVTGPWVFYLDTDEEVSKQLAREITTAIKDNKYQGYLIPRRNYIFGQEVKFGAWWPDYQLRLFKKESAIFKGRVHEQVTLSGEIGVFKNHLIHYNYDTLDQFVSKMNFYSALEAEMLKEKETKFKAFYLLYWPLREFLRRYIRYQGFRDGILGVVLALLIAVNKFVVACKLWEMKRQDG